MIFWVTRKKSSVAAITIAIGRVAGNRWHHKVLERQKMFSYKLVLSNINKFANCKVERADCCWADRFMQCLCSRHRARRRKLRPHGQGKKGKRCDVLKGALHQLVHRSLFSTLRRENDETKTQAMQRDEKEQSKSVQSEPWEAHLSNASSLPIVLNDCYF